MVESYDLRHSKIFLLKLLGSKWHISPVVLANRGRFHNQFVLFRVLLRQVGNEVRDSVTRLHKHCQLLNQ